ncbi:MAG: hypothetical protein U0414_31850 [Polyangiaceae bacterium]
MIPVLPELKLDAKTDGKAEAMLAATIVFPAGRNDIQVQPLFKLKTQDGIGNLFSVGDGGSAPWRAGASVQLVHYWDARGGFDVGQPFGLAQKQRAGALCEQVCKSSGDAPGCKTFLEYQEKSKVKFSLFDYEKFCKAGQDFIEETTVHRIQAPPFALSLGFVYGNDELTYLDNSTPSDVKLVKNEGHDQWRIGVLGTHVWNPWATLEYSVQFGREVSNSKKLGKWCTDEGTLINKPPKEGGADPPDSPVQSCREEALGKPDASYKLDIFAEYGLISEGASRWRLALGPHLSVAFPDGKSAKIDKISLQLPFAVDVIGLPNAVSGDFKGIVRVVPAIENAAGDGNERDWRFVLGIELLAQRTLFSTVANEL